MEKKKKKRKSLKGRDFPHLVCFCVCVGQYYMFVGLRDSPVGFLAVVIRVFNGSQLLLADYMKTNCTVSHGLANNWEPICLQTAPFFILEQRGAAIFVAYVFCVLLL